jgi:DNA-binding beta-propeller fold protein YncE
MIGTGGALTPMTPAAVGAGSSPVSVTVDPSGNYAYVANTDGNTVSQYTIGTDGALTAMTPATVGAGYSPYSVVTTGHFE